MKYNFLPLGFFGPLDKGAVSDSERGFLELNKARRGKNDDWRKVLYGSRGKGIALTHSLTHVLTF